MNAIQETHLGIFHVVDCGFEDQIPMLKTACTRFKAVITPDSITAQQEDLIISNVALGKTIVKRISSEEKPTLVTFLSMLPWTATSSTAMPLSLSRRIPSISPMALTGISVGLLPLPSIWAKVCPLL